MNRTIRAASTAAGLVALGSCLLAFGLSAPYVALAANEGAVGQASRASAGIELDKEVDLGFIVFDVPSDSNSLIYDNAQCFECLANDGSSVGIRCNMDGSFFSLDKDDGVLKITRWHVLSRYGAQADYALRTIEGIDPGKTVVLDVADNGYGMAVTEVYFEKIPGRYGCIEFRMPQRTKAAQGLVDDIIRSMSFRDCDPAGGYAVPQDLEKFGTLPYYEGPEGLEITSEIVDGLASEVGGPSVLLDAFIYPPDSSHPSYFAVLRNTDADAEWTHLRVESVLALCGVQAPVFTE